MKEYKEFQFGTLIFALTMPIYLFLAFAYVNKLGDRPLDETGFIICTLIFVAIYSMFYGMTTTIKNNTITVAFGIGIIKFNIKIHRIRAMRQVTNPVYMGWGIRFFKNGILYNIQGSKAVELAFHDTKRYTRIGTKDPVALMAAIEEHRIRA